MSCCSKDVAHYLDSAKRQLRQYYYQLPQDKMRCHCCVALTMSMSHTEKNPGRLFFKCSRRLCPFFQWVNEDPRGKNRLWLEADKFTCLFDGRLVKRTLKDVLFENPLQKGVRQIINKHMGPFEGNWKPEDLSPRTRSSLDLIVHKDRTGQQPFQDQYLWDEFTPKERLYMDRRGLAAPQEQLVPPNQSDSKLDFSHIRLD